MPVFRNCADWLAEPERLAPGPGPQAMRAALAWLQELAQRQAWPEPTRHALILCADEALTNVTTHARTPDGGPVRLWLGCGHTRDGLALCIVDDGTAFDPTRQPLPALAASLDEARPGGQGLRLMRHYLRSMRYQRQGDRNVLVLEL